MTISEKLREIEEEWADDDGPARDDLAWALGVIKELHAALEESCKCTYGRESVGPFRERMVIAHECAACAALKRCEEMG